MNTQTQQRLETGNLTGSQIRCKISALARKWVKENPGNANFPIYYTHIRGIYHFYNCAEYGFTAKQILEHLTGLPFGSINNYMAKRILEE